jgi:hypothetical protein
VADQVLCCGLCPPDLHLGILSDTIATVNEWVWRPRQARVCLRPGAVREHCRGRLLCSAGRPGADDRVGDDGIARVSESPWRPVPGSRALPPQSRNWREGGARPFAGQRPALLSRRYSIITA